MTDQQQPVRIAAMADLHCRRDHVQQLQPLFNAASAEADVLVLCGDLTDHGIPEEAQALAKELGAVKIPIVAVLGNHDYESGREGEVRDVLAEAGVNVLDGETFEVHGIGFAGTKGFAGGFGRRTLEPWGEGAIKRFVQEALDESLKLESALARLSMEQRIAVLHYAPIQATVEGEPPEIFAFLGSSRLEEPLNRYGVTAAFHGHAHHGTHEGRTMGGVPVYNVSLPLMQRTMPDGPRYKLLEVPRPTTDGEQGT
jgi:Icc-related predicted phosphoesterase